MENKNVVELTLVYIGEDSWNRNVYKDVNGQIFKEYQLITSKIGDGQFYTSDSFDGEPDCPIRNVNVTFQGNAMEKANRKIKTYENWKGSLSDYLQVGDLIDEELKDHFINVLPPACFSPICIQIGEPYSSINGKSTFSTLARVSEGWEYRGECFRGEIKEPAKK
jgi:hypothetical protein